MENEEKIIEETVEDIVETAEAEQTEVNDADTAAVAEESIIDSLKEENAKLNDKYLRTLAEYDNYRKRTQKEKTESYSNGVTKAVMELIPVIDTLEMSMMVPCTDENFRKGIEMTLTKARDALAKLGVTEIEALGKEFDPNLHARVMQEPAEEGMEVNIVTKLFQKGYKLGDKVIRHATVVVSC